MLSVEKLRTKYIQEEDSLDWNTMPIEEMLSIIKRQQMEFLEIRVSSDGIFTSFHTDSLGKPTSPIIPFSLRTIRELSPVVGFSQQHIIRLIHSEKISAEERGDMFLTTRAIVEYYKRTSPARIHDPRKNYRAT